MLHYTAFSAPSITEFYTGPRASLVCSTELSEFAHVLTDWCKMIILIVFAILAVRRIALSGTYVVVN